MEKETFEKRNAHQMEDDRRPIGGIGAWRRCGASGGKQKELCPPDLALVEPFAEDLVLNGLKGREIAADWRWEERGEQLYLFLGKDRLQRDAACGGSIIGENTSLRFRASSIPLSSPRRTRTRAWSDVLQGYLLLGKGGIDPHLV
jgi:hypothetical protein